MPFVKQKTLFYSSSFFHPLEYVDFSCPLLQIEKVGSPSSLEILGLQPPRTIATRKTATSGILSYMCLLPFDLYKVQCITKVSSSSDHFIET